MIVSCQRCDSAKTYRIPGFNSAEKRELLEPNEVSALRTVKKLLDAYDLTHSTAKFLVMHMNLEYGKCHRCNFRDLEGEYEICAPNAKH